MSMGTASASAVAELHLRRRRVCAQAANKAEPAILVDEKGAAQLEDDVVDLELALDRASSHSERRLRRQLEEVQVGQQPPSPPGCLEVERERAPHVVHGVGKLEKERSRHGSGRHFAVQHRRPEIERNGAESPPIALLLLLLLCVCPGRGATDERHRDQCLEQSQVHSLFLLEDVSDSRAWPQEWELPGSVVRSDARAKPGPEAALHRSTRDTAAGRGSAPRQAASHRSDGSLDHDML